MKTLLIALFVLCFSSAFAVEVVCVPHVSEPVVVHASEPAVEPHPVVSSEEETPRPPTVIPVHVGTVGSTVGTTGQVESAGHAPPPWMLAIFVVVVAGIICMLCYIIREVFFD
jgi:hypothetical protein